MLEASLPGTSASLTLTGVETARAAELGSRGSCAAAVVGLACETHTHGTVSLV